MLTPIIEHMIETLAQAPEAGEVEDLTASDLLALARERKAAEDQAAAELLEVAARWADLHPPESIHSAAAFTVPGCEHEEPIAGEGCPLVAEFCIAELGAVLGISTTAAKKLIGHALELRHRLPRLWAQVHSGRVPAWRARIVAETTIHSSPALTMDAARWVDAQVAAVAGRIGAAQLDRLVAETIKRFELAGVDPAADPEDGYLSVDPRHVTIDKDDVHYAGTLHLEADLDIADALDLDQALVHGAALQKALGSTESLDVRRAKALGDLARTQTALDLHQVTALRIATTCPPPARSSSTPTSTPRPWASRPCSVPPGAWRKANDSSCSTRSAAGAATPAPRSPSSPSSTCKPSCRHPAYEIPDRIREQVTLRDRTCVFPWCTRPARGCDVDHIVEHDHDAAAEGRPQPGPTTSSNLGALCRLHHRLKTFTAWTYRAAGPGEYEWTSPHGHRYRRDRTGTTRIDEPEPPERH